MKKPLSVLALALACGSAAVNAADYEIKMLNSGSDGQIMVFSPDYLKVEKGDTVTFVGTDPGHNAESVHVPAGAQGFNSNFAPSLKVTMDTEGVYVYKCLPHAAMAMAGVIQVGAASNKAEAAAAVDQLEAGFAMNQGRLKKAFGQVQ